MKETDFDLLKKAIDQTSISRYSFSLRNFYKKTVADAIRKIK